MKLGFTGSRHGMTGAQKFTFKHWIINSIVDTKISSFLHGDCIGSDVQAACIISDIGNIIIESYPPTNEKHRGCFASDITHPSEGYLKRNKRIVDNCNYLIACPQAEEVIRSGTWSTVRYAKTVKKPFAIIRPDGYIDLFASDEQYNGD